MLLGTIQITGDTLTGAEITDVCRSLDRDTIRLLTLRECKMTDRDYQRILKSASSCKSILQLNLNLGVVSNLRRSEILSDAISRNRSLTCLFLHGSRLGNEGAEVLCRSLSQHPHVTSLDLGDCLLGDPAIRAVCDLLPPNGAKSGLHELTLSANPAITSKGWTHFCIALSACSALRTLCLDYNNLGDYVVGCLAVALPHCRHLHTLDLEGTGITEHGAKVILHLVKNYPVSLRQIILNENKVRESTIEALNICLEESESDTESDDGKTLTNDSVSQTPSTTESYQTSYTTMTENSSVSYDLEQGQSRQTVDVNKHPVSPKQSFQQRSRPQPVSVRVYEAVPPDISKPVISQKHKNGEFTNNQIMTDKTHGRSTRESLYTTKSHSNTESNGFTAGSSGNTSLNVEMKSEVEGNSLLAGTETMTTAYRLALEQTESNTTPSSLNHNTSASPVEGSTSNSSAKPLLKKLSYTT